MREERTIHLIDVPIGGKDGFVWNRLHGEREDICEALLKDETGGRREILQTRLRKIDDALDRLMSGSYGHCSRCGRAINEIKLGTDPATSLCLDCSGSKLAPVTSSSNASSTSDVVLRGLRPFDTILLETNNS